MVVKFVHKVSRGSRFNQIYVPKIMEAEFEVGDIVEVQLIKKKTQLHYSKGLRKLSVFKENLIKEIFSFLRDYNNIRQIFIFGSFLTEKVDYNDIDVLIIVEKESDDFERKIYDSLINEFNLKFHVISILEERLDRLLGICPLTRNMLYFYVSNEEFSSIRERKIDKNHIRFLLMVAEDLLEVELNDGRVYYDVLRRLVTIENFLNGLEERHEKIDTTIEKLIDKRKLAFLRKGDILDKKFLNEIKKIIKIKLSGIYKKI
ncbi:MAG: nucleotidyltransferase domain-containing protein [Nanoarchaeota archaeon]